MTLHDRMAQWLERVHIERWTLLPLRMVVGFGFAAHGYAKLARGPEAFAHILATVGIPAPRLMAWVTALIELLGGVALMLGVCVATLAIPLTFVMATAIFSVHLRYGFSSVKLRGVTASGAEFGPIGYELNLLYIAALLTLALSGPSALSIDRWLAARRQVKMVDTMVPASESYWIRLARPDELARLREIEDAAGTMFSGLGLIDESLDVGFPSDDLDRLVGMGQVWVACPEDGVPVGMVIASVQEGAVYVEEMDVLPAHGKRGIGSRLLANVCEWARVQGHPAVTLSTFRDVPWNGPFYRKHGFRDLRPAEWTRGMREIREREAQHGLRVDARVFMRREL